MKYRLKSGSHSRIENGRRVRYGVGGSFTPTAAELRAFGDKLEPVEDVQEASPAGSSPPPYEDLGGGWYEVNGRKVHGKKALQEVLSGEG